MTSTRYAYYANIIYDQDDPSDYKYGVLFPDLDGALSDGRDLKEAQRMARECLSLWVYSELELGAALPPPTPLESLPPLEPNASYHLIEIDLADYYSKRELHKIGLIDSLPSNAGRNKKKPEERATRSFVVKLTAADMEKLERIAKSEGSTKSGVVKRMIAKWEF